MLVCLQVFSGLAASLVGDADIKVTGNSAMVSWITDVSTGTRLSVKPDVKSVEVLVGKTVSTNHSVKIEGLKTGVEYQILAGTARVWLSTNNLSISVPGSVAAVTAPKEVRKTVPDAPISKPKEPTKAAPAESVSGALPKAPPTRQTWGSVSSLPDHFERHGGDFHAKDQDDYARMAWEFLQRAKAEGYPCKEDEEGVLRVYEPKSGAFASYSREGKTKTFFKPGSRDYFERQPGKIINLKNWK